MDWITDDVAIGNYLEAQNETLLRQGGFKSVLSLDGSLAEDRAGELGLKQIATFRLIDGPGNDLRTFTNVIDALVHLAKLSAPVLVQCHAGRSRSVVVVAAFLMKTRLMEPSQAIELVKSKREANITPALEELLSRVSAEC